MTEYKNTMLISPDEVKSAGFVNYNVSDDVIGAAIRTSQKVYLRDVIGNDLLEKLQVLVYNAIIGEEPNIDSEENIAYKTLLDDYISDVLTYRVSMELCSYLTMKLRNIALVKNSDTNAQPVNLDELQFMQEQYDTLFNDGLNRMVEFICSNKAAYPESDFTCGCGKNPKYANTNLWLGK